MEKSVAHLYRCPKDKSALLLDCFNEEQGKVINGLLKSETGFIYKIENSIPDLTYPTELAKIDKETKASYEKLAVEYDKFSSIPFQTFKSSEKVIRNDLIDRLDINKDSKVLEVGCGCGDGSQYIAERLGVNGELFLQELSPAFLNIAIDKLKSTNVPVEFSVANACYLSFPDNYFDAAHHFGGSNTFSEIERFLSEMARVVKPGGKVVIGDEGMAPWLRNTEFGKIMMNSNPLLKFSPPIKFLPRIAKNVKVEWIMMGAFFIIEFTVGEAEPVADYHVPIPSERGGTHWTRYYGQLEGVSDEAKAMAYQAQKKSGKSMTEWLDDAVKNAASKGRRL